VKRKFRSYWSPHRRMFCAFSFVSVSTFYISQNGRSFARVLFFKVLLPYTSSYTLFLTLFVMIRRHLSIYGSGLSERTIQIQKAFFTMQMLQGLLPLTIIFPPFVIFMTGCILGTNINVFTIIFTIFMWLCPVVQAAVQLRFLRQAESK
ncbi:hypothetical protein PFISCL1PPCAC_12688, partial [Pristionchus fissidentatus]